VTTTFQTNFFTGRVHFAPHLTTAFSLGPVHFVPSIGIDETFYSESQFPNGAISTPVGTDLVRSARDFSVAMILPSLEKIYDKKTFLGDKLKHVIEPRVTYNYVTGIGTDFDRFIRFDDNDLLANTSDLDLSLTNRILAKRGDTVTEIFSWDARAEALFRPDLRRRLNSRPGQRFRQHRRPYGLFVPGGAAEHWSPVVSTLRMPLPPRGFPFNGKPTLTTGIPW
jgi:hypothetical protein